MIIRFRPLNANVFTCLVSLIALASASAPGHVNALVRDIQPAVTASKGKEGDALTDRKSVV